MATDFLRNVLMRNFENHRDEGGLPTAKLRRTLTLPWLVFYGVGVTVGAGIFALIGEIVGLTSDAAPMSFLIAGLIAAITGVSYAILVSVYPLAGGEAVFVTRGLGPILGWLAGVGVAITGIVSSATLSVAFAGYASSLIGLPHEVYILCMITILAGVAWFGIKESVLFAAFVTVLEVGTLLLVFAFGLPYLSSLPNVSQLTGMAMGTNGFALVLSGAVLAFFAFIGFEDIVNLAEETAQPKSTVPRAIIWTLVLTVFIYFALSLIAVSVPGRDEIVQSSAPMAVLFSNATGLSGKPIVVLASVAMINGILVQIIMSSRVLYGMANEGLLPNWFAVVDPHRRTPSRATFFVAIFVLTLALALPLVRLAEITSLVVLGVFAFVNLSLFVLGNRSQELWLKRWRYWGLFGTFICAAILAFQLSSGLTAGH